MNINRFFTEVLGANLRNTRWSWGAVDPMANRVYLRVWADDIRDTDGDKWVQVGSRTPRRQTARSSAGFKERHRHLELIRRGAEGFGVVCTAQDPDTEGIRAIAHFNSDELLRLGPLQEQAGRIYARVEGRIPIVELVRQRTGQSTLAEDIRALTRQKNELTIKEALVNARVGQGIFRSQVLRLWDHRCAVTRSGVLDAIRASHIKPWRNSTDEERLDPENGIPLLANLDALFDAGLISFDSSRALLVTSRLNADERHIFDIDQRLLTMTPSTRTAEYLAYHRDHVFLK
jgi:hypothetical protein